MRDKLADDDSRIMLILIKTCSHAREASADLQTSSVVLDEEFTTSLVMHSNWV
jgi:hypothetical protein